MIGPTGTVRVMVATRPVDFRKGAEGLAALAREMIQADPFNGSIYVFRAKRADRVKMVFWDGTSVCLFSKLLEDGQFRWPRLRGRRRPVAGAAATDRGRHADRDDGGSRHRLQIRRPPAVVSPSPDLRAARHSSRPLDARRLGRARRVPLAPHPRAHSRSPQVLNEAFRRRDDGAGARPWAWADENRSTLGLRARRQALGRIGPASGRLCLCAEQEVRTAHCASRRLQGVLQVDGYAGYRVLAEKGDVRLAFCWTHVRRRFYELAVAGPAPIASEALERIAALYAIEQDIRGRSAEERRAVRQNRTRPLLTDLETWLRQKLSLISQKIKLAEATPNPTGSASPASSTTVASRWTPTLLSARSVPSR
jgi:Transposase IS66 family/IS66 Orf2 like protein